MDAPKTPQRLLWDRLIFLLKNNANLRAVTKLMQLYEGTPNDLTEWNANTLPALRITPAGDSAAMSAEHQHDAPLVVEIEIATPTTYAGDLFDYWGLVQTVFFPGDNSVLNALLAPPSGPQLAYMIRIARPAWKPMTLKDGTKALYGKGAIVFDQHLNT